jgi:Na+-driven multidrug efflux pump
VLGRGHPEYGLYTTLICTPLTMVLYAVLIPSLGAMGAALASSTSFTLNFLLTAAFFRRATGGPILPLLMPTRSELADYAGLLRSLRARAGRGA